MVCARPAWTVAEVAGREGARQRVEKGNGGTSQGRESQSGMLKHQHNQWGFFSLFSYQQQLGSDINNLIRNLENWFGLSGGKLSRKEGRRIYRSPLLHQPL